MDKILTGEEVISAIAIKIRESFTTTELAAVYKDTPIEDILKPCVFLNLVTVTHTPRMKNKGNRSYIVDIIATGSDDNTELYTWYSRLAERLFAVIDKITISEQTVRLIRAETNIENNELHLIITYNFNVIKVEDDEYVKMMTRSYNGRVI